ncbi:co-chaperone GroES [Candidatus Liberibacter sp.]|uniref:co-chaperone GroES n=1 Tax=Candidatus Liberibacter sp. TaxID=34022 RepID=UPI0015F74E6F|nr:co-chaperone GroES [Candidatus Liberibacter sp.]MBA5724185.1 co-chaperone GroES [Candidatus Liberibacter sp.]
MSTTRKLRPMRGRVVVRRVPSETKTSGGIIIPDSAAEKPCEGKVISVGPGAYDTSGNVIPPEVKEGDLVMFAKWSGSEITISNEDYLVMQETDIIGVLEDKKGK